MSQPASPGTTKTWWSGDSSPEDRKDAQTGILIGVLVAALITPVTMLTAVLGYLAFTRWRIYYTVLFQLAALSTIILGVTGLLTSSVMGYPDSIKTIVEAVGNDFNVQGILSGILTQVPVSIILGLWLSSAYSWWRWVRRNSWEQFSFRLTPLQALKRKRNINALKEGTYKVSPGDAALGVETETGKVITLTQREAASHTLLIGSIGSGKTTTELMRSRYYIQAGEGYVVIDLKGANDLPEYMAEQARINNRPFRHFLFHDPRQEYTGPAEDGPSYYDPISRGDASRRKDMIINSRKWTEEHYKLIAEAYLQTAFDVIIGSPRDKGTLIDGLGELIEVLDPGELSDRARNLPIDPYYDEIRNSVYMLTSRNLDKDESSVVQGIRRQLTTMRTSTAGRWLRVDKDPEKNIDLKKAAAEGEIIVFSLDSLNYPEVSKAVANLIISDLKTVAGERGQADMSTLKPLHIFIDEFSALDSDGLVGLINKSRSSAMPTTIATQVLADLKKIDNAFLGQLIGIVNCFIIHRSNSDEEAQIFAGLVGKEVKTEVSMEIEHTSGILGKIGKGAATGSGRLNQKEDFIYPARTFQELGPGEAIFIAKSPKNRHVKLQVIQADGGVTRSGFNEKGNKNAPIVQRQPAPQPVEDVVEHESLANTKNEQDENYHYDHVEVHKPSSDFSVMLKQKLDDTPKPQQEPPPTHNTPDLSVAPLAPPTVAPRAQPVSKTPVSPEATQSQPPANPISGPQRPARPQMPERPSMPARPQMPQKPGSAPKTTREKTKYFQG